MIMIEGDRKLGDGTSGSDSAACTDSADIICVCFSKPQTGIRTGGDTSWITRIGGEREFGDSTSGSDSANIVLSGFRKPEITVWTGGDTNWITGTCRER